jgi:hypothetical protein
MRSLNNVSLQWRNWTTNLRENNVHSRRGRGTFWFDYYYYFFLMLEHFVARPAGEQKKKEKTSNLTERREPFFLKRERLGPCTYLPRRCHDCLTTAAEPDASDLTWSVGIWLNLDDPFIRNMFCILVLYPFIRNSKASSAF